MTVDFNRKTRGKVRMCPAEARLTVEMEVSALFAVAKSRRALFAQIVCRRQPGRPPPGASMRDQARELVFRLAAESCLTV